MENVKRTGINDYYYYKEPSACAECFQWHLYIRLFICSGYITLETRMHSSGMRTVRLLTVSQHALWWGDTCPGGGGVPARGCTCPGGVPARGYLAGGYLPAQRGTCPDTPPCGQRDMCKNITFANFVCGW